MSDRACWVLAQGVVHLPMLQGPGLLLTYCQRSDGVGHYGLVPQGARHCLECFGLLPVPGFAGEIPAAHRLSPRGPGRQPDPPPPPIPRWGLVMTTSQQLPAPQPFLDQLRRDVAPRSMLRQIAMPAQQAPALTDDHLRGRLAGLTRTARVAQ